MKMTHSKALLMLFALLAATNVFSQCSICSTPAAPVEYGGAITATYYKGATIQLWAVHPSTAICERDWYEVVGTDTTSVGTGDTISVVTDTTCKYIARNKNTCSGTNYYSSYVVMATITVVSGTKPTFTIGMSTTICSGTYTDIFLWSATSGVTFVYLRNDTPSVTGSLNGTSSAGPLSVALTNTTGSSQVVRMVIRMKNSSNYYTDDQVVYVTVLNSTAPSGNHCFAPSAPNPFPNITSVYTYIKGATIELMADTTVAADTVQWYKVVGTDTTYVGWGYSLSTTVDTICTFIARNENVCNCSTSSIYYSSWKQMLSCRDTTAFPLTNFTIINYMPTIASGTQVDLAPYMDSASFATVSFYRDNAYVSGTTSAGSSQWSALWVTLTNTTSVPQLVRFWIFNSESPYAPWVVNKEVLIYVIVNPSTSTAPAGNHCTVPSMMNIYNNNSSGNLPQNFWYVQGATVNLDLNHFYSNAFDNYPVTSDSVVFYKSRWPGDTTNLGSSYPVNATMDTNCRIFSVSENVCYWSDSSKHIYRSAFDYCLNAHVLAGTVPTVTMTNSAPYLCNGQPVNISVSAASGSIVAWLRDNQPPVKGILSNNLYYTFPQAIRDTLTDTVSTSQIIHFEAFTGTTISGHNCLGSTAMTTVTTYPACSNWANDTIGVHPAYDSICSGASATLTADTLPCNGGTRYVWSSGDTTRSITKTASGTYTVTATSACGCTATASGTVFIRSNPTPAVNNDTICAGATASMTAAGGVHYLWSNGDTTANFTTGTAGTYSVTATNTYGCSATASGVVIVNPTPLPPAAPVFLSTCTDSPYNFIFDYVSAWGYQLQWSINGSFSDSTVEDTILGYLIHPFTVLVPGDTSETVWMRSVSSLTGCLSSSVNTVIQTNQLPLQKTIYATDTILPQDSTTMIVILNSQNGIMYTMQNGDSVLVSALGSGDTLYMLTPPLDTFTVIDLYGANISTGCSKRLYHGQFHTYSRVDSMSQVFVTISHSRPILACQPDTLYIAVTNNTNHPIDTVLLNLVVSTPDFSCNGIAVTNPLAGISHSNPPVTVSDSLYQVRMDTIPPNSTWAFSMILFTNCSTIPDTVPATSGTLVQKNDTTNGIYLWVSNAIDTIAVNNVPNITSADPYHIVMDSIEYPIFDVDLTSTSTFDVNYTRDTTYLNTYNGCAGVGDTFVRRSYFVNKGSANFFGGIRMRDSMNCAGLTLLKADILMGAVTDSLSATGADSLLASGYVYYLSSHNVSVGNASDIILEEKFAVSSCLGGACKSIVSMIWGCDTINLCKTQVPTPYTYLTQDCRTPSLRISRILPVSNMPDGRNFWDSTCMNSLTKWEFLVQNYDTAGTEAMNNIHIILSKNQIGSYSFISKDSIWMGSDSLPLGDMLTDTIRYLTVDTFDTIGRFIPVCFYHIDSPILSIDMRIRNFNPGDKFYFSFYTYQCCPSDTQLFNQGFEMNDWTINAYGYYCGNTGSGFDSLPATGYGNHSASPPLYYPFAGDNIPDAISLYYYDQDPDFGPVSQAFINTHPNMQYPETDTFYVQNIAISDDFYEQYYQMLFLQGNGINSGTNPSFTLLVDIITDTGLSVQLPKQVYMQDAFNGYTWADSIVTNGTNLTEVAFNIDSLDRPNDDTAVGGPYGAAAFANFFNNSVLHFPLTSHCPAAQPVRCTVNMYLVPRSGMACDSCKVPLTSLHGIIMVDCPGCITPGAIPSGYDLERINFGLRDSLNIGLVSSMAPIDASYPYYNLAAPLGIDKKSGIVGDTLRSTVLVNFEDGESPRGFTYASWDSFWTSKGNPNAYFPNLFREQSIPGADSLHLTLIADTLFYTPADPLLPTYTIALPTGMPYVKDSSSTFIFRESIHLIDSLTGNDSLAFKPLDEYKFVSYFVICRNFDMLSLGGYQSNTLAAAYFTTPYDSAMTIRYGVTTGAGDYYSMQADTNTVNHDSIISPEQQFYYLCQTNNANFKFDYVSFDVTGPDNFSDENTLSRCNKSIIMGLTAEIQGPLIQNNFPFEFRPIPGLTSGDTININDTSCVYAYLIKSLAPCYSMAPPSIQTNGYYYTSFSTHTQFYETASGGYRTGTSGTSMSYSFPGMFAYATLQNYTQTSLPFLIADEYFSQVLTFKVSSPACAGCPDTLWMQADTTQQIILPALSACNSAFVDTPIGVLIEFIRPHALDSPVAFPASVVVSSGAFEATQTISITRDDPDNLYLYIDTLGIPECLSIDSITPYISPLTIDTPRHVGPYLLFDLGFDAGTYSGHTDNWAYQSSDLLTFYFHWKCCPPSDTFNLPFYINWRCDTFPTTLPDTACHEPVADVLPLIIQSASFNQNYTISAVDSFSPCDSLHFSVWMQAYGQGTIHGVTDSLVLPTGLALASSIAVSYYADSAVGDTIIYTTLHDDTVAMPPLTLAFPDSFRVSFTALPNCHYTGLPPVEIFHGLSFCSSPVNRVYVGFDTLYQSSYNACGPKLDYDSVISAGCYSSALGRISIETDSLIGWSYWSWSPSSMGTVDTMANHLIAINVPTGITYTVTDSDGRTGCKLIIKDDIKPDSALSVSNLSKSNPVCSAMHNGAINLVAAGGAPPYTYLWSNGATVPNLTGLSDSIYTVTVTDHNGCTAKLSDTLIYTTTSCCVSSATPPSAAQALTFGGGTSTQFLQQLYNGGFAGYVNLGTHTLNGLTQDIYIDGMIVLNSDLYIINCPNLLFSPNAGILDTAWNLHIESSTLYACTDTMWQGVEVRNSQAMVYINQATNLLPPMIRDARKGVYSHNNAKDSILDCFFTNDWIGIYLDGSAGIPHFSVSNSTFNTNIPMYGALKHDTADNPNSIAHPSSAYSDAGVYVKSPTGQFAKATVGSITGRVNTFHKINCGVYCWYNSLEVVNGKFDSINLPPTQVLIGYSKPYLGRAIYVTNSTASWAFNTLKVGDMNSAGANTIGYCYRGLDEIGNTIYTHVIGNKITTAVNTGIFIGPNNASSMKIGYNTLDATHTGNMMQTGISVNTCQGWDTINANTILLIDSTTYSSSTPDTGAATGISATAMGRITGKVSFLIDSNVISEVQWGIRTFGCQLGYIQENQINLKPIPYHNLHSFWVGISSETNSLVQTWDNLINGGGTSTVPTYAPNDSLSGKLMGIYIQSPTPTGNVFSCNGIENTHWCIAASGTNIGNQTLMDNRFFTSQTGVTIFMHGHIGLQGSPIYGTTNDNEWDTLSGSLQYSHGVFNAVGSSNLFYLRSPAGTIYNPVGILAQRYLPYTPFPIFSISSGNSIASCSLPHPTFPGRDFFDRRPYLESIALDTIQFASDTIDNLKWAHESLIELIQDWPAILDSSAVIDSFYTKVSDTSFTQLMYVFAHMQSDTDATNQAYYQAILKGVIPLDQNESNLQTIGNLYLTYFMVMPDSFWQTGNLMDSADLSTLYCIAKQCYLPGGPAVFLARSMYWNAIRDNSIQFYDECVYYCDSGKHDRYVMPKTPTRDSTYLFRVYPNPLDKENSLNILSSLTGDISFYDALGQLTYKTHLVAGLNTFNCSQLSCENEVILYKAILQGGKIETGKIVTLR